MTQEILLNEMLAEMRQCIQKEDVKAGLPNDNGQTYDIEHIFVLWQQFKMNIENLERYIGNLDDEIASRVPWGDIIIDSTEGFDPEKPVTRFWTAQKDCFAENIQTWATQYKAKLISEGDYLSYFTTTTPLGTEVVIEGAEKANVCPSPASTLIMLQTRAKDSLNHELLKQNDFAVAHYREVEKSLGLKDTITFSKRKRLVHKIRRIFRK